MGARTRSFANLLNTDGTFLSGAINNTSLSGLTDIPSAAKSDLVPIIGYGLGNDAAMEHVHGNRSGVAVFDSTYDAYCFTFTNIVPTSNDVVFQFNMSTDSGANYNVTKTTTYYRAYHDEADTFSGLIYDTVGDLAQGTGDVQLARGVTGAESDLTNCGELWIFNPASTTYQKHFYSKFTQAILTGGSAPYNQTVYTSGYGNTTSAINGVIFRMSSGNLSTGNIRVYGLK